MKKTDPNDSQATDSLKTMGSGWLTTAPGDSSRVNSSGEEDLTIISSGPPLLPIRRGLHPLELGKTLEGERLGHFQLQQFIGGGGMGAVFRALDTMLNRIVAVKVLSTEHASDEETIRRFKNEAQSAARLDHENIARVYYVGEDRGVHYIVFEHIEGINVRDLVNERGPLPLADAVSYTLQVSEALSHASQRDVVHRDIKPSNILITPGGRAKLVDMGLARLHQVEQSSNDLTASGVTLGTFDYISPEQARDPRTADVRSDLYSLGCTLYFMLTGRPPFPQGTVLQKLLMHQGELPPDPREFRPDLPAEVSDVVGKLLAKSPEARFQQPSDLIEHLLSLSGAVGLGLPSQRGWISPSRAKVLLTRHLPWVAPALLLLAAVVFVDQFWANPARDTVVFDPFKAPPASSRSEQPAKSGDTPAVPGEEPADQELEAGLEEPDSSNDSQLASTPASQDNRPPTPTTKTLPAKDSEKMPVADSQKTKSDRPEKAAPSEGTPAPSTSAENEKPAPTSPAQPGAEAKTEKVPPKNADPRAGVLVVAPGSPGAYWSLRAACNAAQSGDVIELRYNDLILEKPFLLSNLKLTIRAGEGFSPRVVFQPGPNEIDPVQYPRDMITVSGGSLTLVNVELELDVPRAVPAERWALLVSRGADSIRLERCWLTIRNSAEAQTAYHPGVAFFEAHSATGGDTLLPESAPIRETPLSLRLEHCVVRGEATLLHSAQMQPVHLAWENGLLAVSEWLLQFETSGPPSRVRVETQIDLRHLTASVGRGLVQAVESGDTVSGVLVRLKCVDSIFLGGPGSSLIVQVAPPRTEKLRDAIAWYGERNFYEGFRDFWQVSAGTQDGLAQPMDLVRWQAYWNANLDGDETLPRLNSVVWQNSLDRQRSLHTHTPENYLLSKFSPSNPAKAAASDGRDVGFRFNLLPLQAPRSPLSPLLLESTKQL